MANIESMRNYYKTLNHRDINNAININDNFQIYNFYYNSISKDLYFYGIKIGSNIKFNSIKEYVQNGVTKLNIDKISVYYHICAKGSNAALNIVKDQLSTLKMSKLYNLTTEINCCLTGDDITNYNWLLNNIKLYGSKFKIVKSQFNDTSYERFTLNYMGETLSQDFCLYLHSKGMTKLNDQNVITWRKCMEFFLIEKAEECLNKMITENYDTVGVMYQPNPPHYHGNFWWAKTSYLKELFANHTIGSDYLDPEFFVCKNNPKSYDIYPAFSIHNNFCGYFYHLPREIYCNHLKTNEIEIQEIPIQTVSEVKTDSGAVILKYMMNKRKSRFIK
jgi:hypothetical protein